MSRLVHSENALSRAMEISKNQLFIFTEGGLDRPFCQRLVGNLFPNRAWQFRIIATKELPAATGGKPALIKHYKKLRRKGHLSYIAFEKPMASLFFADKDIDDITRQKLRSDHFLYTKTYDIEGYLFSSGDLTEAISAACQVTTQQANAWINNHREWLKSICINWADWITLCIISQTKKINIGCGYSRPSPINGNSLEATNPVALQEFIRHISLALSTTEAEAQTVFDKMKIRVVQTIESGDGLKLMKGKWIASILEKYLKNSFKVPDATLDAAGSRALTVLVSHVGKKTNCPACIEYATSVRNVCATL